MIECCANSIQSALNGEQGGGARIELCAELEMGGITPKRKDILKTNKRLLAGAPKVVTFVSRLAVMTR